MGDALHVGRYCLSYGEIQSSVRADLGNTMFYKEFDNNGKIMQFSVQKQTQDVTVPHTSLGGLNHLLQPFKLPNADQEIFNKLLFYTGLWARFLGYCNE